VGNDQEHRDDEERPEDLSDELAKKYDPERLLKMISKRAGRGESLDASLRAKYEKKFGVDLGHVRLITGEFAEEFNKQRGAYAVTVGTTGMILMGGSADRAMNTRSGQALLAHELTHVAQARKALSYDKPFASEGGDHEEEAREVEAEEQTIQKKHGPSPQQIQDARDATVEEVKQRVMDMFTDAYRNKLHRSGSTRRA
jgi:Domain of unknown function (DUF4157)